MNEARRFIRYLIPGIVCFVELVLFFYISAPDYLMNFLQEDIFSAGSGIGLFGSALLGLGGLGYILATIYHGASKFSIFRQPKHRCFLINSLDNNLIALRKYGNNSHVNQDEYKKLDQIDAWYIMGAYYHARIYEPKFKEAHNRIESMNDILHSLGATCVGTIIVSIFWGIKNYYVLCGDIRLWHFLAPIFLLFVITWNYLKTGYEATKIIDAITAQFIVDEASSGKKIDMYI